MSCNRAYDHYKCMKLSLSWMWNELSKWSYKLKAENDKKTVLFMLTLDLLEISHKKSKNSCYRSKTKENVGKKFIEKDTLDWLVKKHTSEGVL